MAPSRAPRAGGAPGQRLGRFELLRVLGQGAQATVWLARDPHLQREVAVKVALDAVSADAADAPGGWLREARHVSRLAHPGVVPLFECFVHEHLPCLVFEYVPGETLAQHLRRGAVPARRAVEIAIAMLDALDAAHAAGLVHRDLKPSNVLIDPQGRVRVMDFGIAVPIAGAAEGWVAGTPGYMAPEAARGEAPTPAMDLFAVGVVLAEMLSGERLLNEPEPVRALARVQAENLELPARCSDQVDEPLRALVRRALARDPGQRWDRASAFRQALERWLNPEAPPGGDAAAHGTLDFLLRRMRLKSDFPALSTSMARIQRLTASDTGSLQALSQEVLQDVALTQKLLRLVNTAGYRHVGGGTITTVSRAVSLLGFSAVRSLSMSLVLLERLDNQAHAQMLRDLLLRSLLAGHIAAQLAHGTRDAEVLFVGALFHDLGRLLCAYYLPEEAAEVRRRLDASPGTEEAQASAAVLGLSYEALGLGVAAQWGLPESLQRCMRRPAGGLAGLRPSSDRALWWCLAANQAAEAMTAADERQRAERLRVLLQRCAAAGERVREVEQALRRAAVQLAEWVRATGLRLTPGSPVARALAEAQATDRGGAPGRAPAETPAGDVGATSDHGRRTPTGPGGLSAPGAGAAAGDDTCPGPGGATGLGTRLAPSTRWSADAPTLVQANPDAQGRVLGDGVDRIAERLASEEATLHDVVLDVLETLRQALALRRVLFCLREARDDRLHARLSAGDAAPAVLAAFRVPLRVSPSLAPDLFTAVCLKGVDTVIADAAAPAVAARLPSWFVPPVWAPTFLLLPVVLRQTTVALVYADRPAAGSIVIAERELRQVRTLRNQIATALRQSR